MAKTPSKDTSKTKVTRITASDSSDAPKQPKAVKANVAKVTKAKPAIDSKKAVVAAKAEKRERRNRRNPFSPISNYLKGSWYELTQVRWPDRRATWGMTGALLLFTLFFIVIILIFDYAFAELFKLILGSN